MLIYLTSAQVWPTLLKNGLIVYAKTCQNQWKTVVALERQKYVLCILQ